MKFVKIPFLLAFAGEIDSPFIDCFVRSSTINGEWFVTLTTTFKMLAKRSNLMHWLPIESVMGVSRLFPRFKFKVPHNEGPWPNEEGGSNGAKW